MGKGKRIWGVVLALAIIPQRMEAGWEPVVDSDLTAAFVARTVAFDRWGSLDFKSDGRLLAERYWGVWRVAGDRLCLVVEPVVVPERCYRVERQRIDLRLYHTGTHGGEALVATGRYIDLN